MIVKLLAGGESASGVLLALGHAADSDAADALAGEWGFGGFGAARRPSATEGGGCASSRRASLGLGGRQSSGAGSRRSLCGRRSSAQLGSSKASIGSSRASIGSSMSVTTIRVAPYRGSEARPSLASADGTGSGSAVLKRVSGVSAGMSGVSGRSERAQEFLAAAPVPALPRRPPRKSCCRRGWEWMDNSFCFWRFFPWLVTVR